jgi:hypothetical protein
LDDILLSINEFREYTRWFELLQHTTEVGGWIPSTVGNNDAIVHCSA